MFFSIKAAVTEIIGKAEYFKSEIIRLTIYIPSYLTVFKIRLSLRLYIYKACLLKLPFSSFLYKTASDKRLILKLSI
jgi:hypothetical protein